MMTNFPEVLEEFRKKKQMAKNDLATRAGLSAGYISLLTRGSKKTPSAEAITALANALELDREERAYLFSSAGLSIPSSSTSVIPPNPLYHLYNDKQVVHPLRKDWGDAPSTQIFYGREEELAKLQQWILSDRCKLVALLGFSGIGKTMLAAKLIRQIEDQFDYVLWQSLKDAPHLETFLEKSILLLSDQRHLDLPWSLEERLLLLIKYLREHRCLLILDNLESILQREQHTGEYQKGYEGYGSLIKKVGETEHKSCLILTSREKPQEIAILEGLDSPTRVWELKGLKPVDGWKILRDKGIYGDEKIQEAEELIKLYKGNPLALKVAAELIRDVFAGDISKFLKSNRLVFSDVEDVLEQQFERLSELERDIIYWLTIEREPISLDDLSKDLIRFLEIGEIGILLKALQSLKRRSLIETDEEARYTLQPAVMEYVVTKLIQQICKEINTGIINFLASHALIKAQAKDYVRKSQIDLILLPLAQQLIVVLGRAEFEEKLKYILRTLPRVEIQQPNYAAGNILNFLIQLGYDLTGYDFSHQYVWEVYLQGRMLINVNFSEADLKRSVFTDTFRSILSVALSSDDNLLAAGTENGEVRLWDANSGTPLRTYHGHGGRVRSVAFSPDGKTIVSGSEDRTLRLWSINSDQCIAILRGHTNRVRTVDFSPDEEKVVSGGEDQTVRIWNVQTGECLKVLKRHTDPVRSVAFSPTGNTIASGGDDHQILIWDVQKGNCLTALKGHTGQVYSVSFSPDGTLLLSGSQDNTVRLWKISSGECLYTLKAHDNQVRSVAFNNSGDMFASGGDDQIVRVWDVQAGTCLQTLKGHIHRVYSVTFGHRENMIVSGSEDQTVCFWDARSGHRLKTLFGYVNQIRSVSFSPSGSELVSGGDDQIVRVWDVQTGQCLRILQGHTNGVRSVCFSPDGAKIASGSDDKTVRLWDAHIGKPIRVLEGHIERVRAVSFSLDGTKLASGSEDQRVRIWDVESGQCLQVLEGHTDWVRSVAFSPDGTKLVSGSEDKTVKIWDLLEGQCLYTLTGHTDGVRTASFSPDGNLIVSSSDDQTIRLWESASGTLQEVMTDNPNTRWILSANFSPDGAFIASGSEDQLVRIWDVQTGQCLKRLPGHQHRIYSVVFSPDGAMLASGSLDGLINLWNVQTGACLKTLRNNKPYQDMNITDAWGLTRTQQTILQTLGAIGEAKEEKDGIKG